MKPHTNDVLMVNYMALYAALDHEEQPHANNTEQPRSTDMAD